MVKMCHNPMHLNNHELRDGLRVFRQYLYPFSRKRGKNKQNIAWKRLIALLVFL